MRTSDHFLPMMPTQQMRNTGVTNGRLSTGPAVGPHKHGFTLIELLVVIAIIGILISLLLPAVQKVREASARTRALENCRLLGESVTDFLEANGSYPTGDQLDKLFAESGFGVDPNDGRGIRAGYFFAVIPPPNGMIEAWPLFPGRTGDLVFMADLSGVVGHQFVHPDADFERDRMFQEILERARKWLLDVAPRMAQRPFAEVIDAPEQSGRLPTVFDELNSNGDDVLTLGEIAAKVLSLDQKVLPLADLLESMRLGAGGEEVGLIPGIRLDDVDTR